jgi:hypothetical protein
MALRAFKEEFDELHPNDENIASHFESAFLILRWSHLIVFLLSIPFFFVKESVVHDMLGPTKTSLFKKKVNES